MKIEYKDKQCPKCGSKNIDVIDHFITDLLEVLEDGLVKVYACAVLLGCRSCGHTWSCEGCVTQ